MRVDPNKFAPLPQNPLFGDAEANAARIIATGFRNPYRAAVDSASGRIYVGGAGADEINLVEGNTLFNSGWPCYEGPGTTQNTFWLTTTICQNLIADGAHNAPLYSYGRNNPIVPGEPCANGGLAISGVALNRSGFGGQSLDGALFFTDYTRNCIWYFPAAANGRPDTSNPVLFASDLGTYQAALTITDQDGLANVTTRTVDVVSSNFTVAIAEPANGRTFKAGARVPIQASATYAGGGALPSSAFSWRLNVAVTAYLIYRSTNGSVGPLYATSPIPTYDDNAVTNGVTYTYTVKATDAAGNISYRTNLSSRMSVG